MFNLRELSRFAGRPVTLYRFDRQHLSWTFAAADRDIVLGGVTYQAVRGGITRSAIRDTSEAKKSELKITLPYLRDPAAPALPVTQTLGDNWWPYAPGDEVAVTVMETHYTDPDAEVRVVWMGVVIGPEFSDTELGLTCAPGRVGTRKSGLALRWSRGCPLVHYSQGRGMCNVVKTDHALPATLSTVSGFSLEAPEFGTLPAGRLRGGMVVWTRATDGLQTRLNITGHTGNVITVNQSAPDLAVGLEVVVFPGCARTWEDCTTYYNNGDNYGGCRHLPIASLFDGNRRVS